MRTASAFFSSGVKPPRDIKKTAHESALDAPDLLAVQKHLGLPVDPVKVEPDVLAGNN